MTIKYPSHKNVIRPIAEGVSAGDVFDAIIRQKFIQYFYSYTSAEDLSAHSSEQLCAMALSHLRLMSDLAPNEIKVKVFNPSLAEDGWECPHTVVQVVLQDRPFLVDSLRMEITRLNLDHFFMVHMGGMLVLRDNKGAITDIERYKGQEIKVGVVEAPIYIEIEKQHDPAAMESIRLHLLRVLNDVCIAVADWPNMCEKMRVLSDESSSKKNRLLSDLPERARLLILSNENRIFISKTNTISTVHRPVYTDYVGVKRLDKNGKLIGERRFIGLYTSTAYSSDPQTIPFLRHKVLYVLKKSQLPKHSHSGKDLQHILANLPRDDVFYKCKSDVAYVCLRVKMLMAVIFHVWFTCHEKRLTRSCCKRFVRY